MQPWLQAVKRTAHTISGDGLPPAQLLVGTGIQRRFVAGKNLLCLPLHVDCHSFKTKSTSTKTLSHVVVSLDNFEEFFTLPY